MKLRKALASLFAILMLASVCMTGITAAEAELPFTDVKGHWAYQYIEYAYENGLMNGTGGGATFSPDMSLTRGMVVTVLYRDNGSPKMGYNGTFVDVAEGEYYTSAAEWAYANSIVNGTGTDDWGDPLFSPNRDITRQELATMFKRYADFKCVDTSVGAADISGFTDNGRVASWASEAVKWAVGVRIITGKTNGGVTTLSPEDKAVRAEFATIIMRFNEADFEYRLVFNTPKPISTYTEPEASLVNDADIYVAVDGNDTTGDGSLAKPLATLEAAKAKARTLKAGAKDEIVIAFKAGDYGVLSNVTFDKADSGTADVPITYCAYGDGDVYFTNGIYIDDGEFKPLDESDKLFFREENLASIMKVDLSDNPLADKLTASSPLSGEDGFCWQARVPNKSNGIDQYYSSYTKHVIHPDSYFNSIEELVAAVNTDEFQEDLYGDEYNEGVASHIDQNRIQAVHSFKALLDSYRTFENVQLVGYIGKVWNQDTLDISAYDKETGILSTSSPQYIYYAMIESSQQVFLNNVSEELDAVGEYWIDMGTKTLYVYKPEGTYTIATEPKFITVNKNADYLTFRGLSFRCCSDDAITVKGSNFTFDGCSISYVGGKFAFLAQNGYNVKFTDNTVAYCAENGVFIAAPKYNKNPDYFMLKETGCLVDNNLVHDVGMMSVPVETAAIKVESQIGAVVSHNEVYNSARYGIEFKYSNIECVVEYNYVHDCMQNSSDGGALYCGRTAIHRGTVIRYNIIADIFPLSRIHTGGTFSIYLDDYQEDVTIYGNVFYNCGELCNNNGSRHKIHDNVFIKSGTKIWGKASFYEDISKYDYSWFDEDWNDLGNIPDENTPAGQLWKSKWPELYDILAIYNDPSCYKDTELYKAYLNECYNNYCFDGASHSFSEPWLEHGYNENNTEFPAGENPIFADPTHGDYSIIDGADFADNQFAKIGRY